MISSLGACRTPVEILYDYPDGSRDVIRGWLLEYWGSHLKVDVVCAHTGNWESEVFTTGEVALICSEAVTAIRMIGEPWPQI